MKHGKCKVCGQETDIHNFIHAGTGHQVNIDGTPYKADWYCKRHYRELLLKEVKEYDRYKDKVRTGGVKEIDFKRLGRPSQGIISLFIRAALVIIGIGFLLYVVLLVSRIIILWLM